MSQSSRHAAALPQDGKDRQIDRPETVSVPIFRRAARCGCWAILLSCGSMLAGCDLAQMSQTWDRYPSRIDALAARPGGQDPVDQQRRRGQVVFQQYCAICHGDQGRGDGFNSAMLDPKPRNFSDAPFWQEITDEKLASVISKGGKAAGKSSLMPAWGQTLKAEQIQDVMAYLKILATTPVATTPPGDS